MNRRDFIKLVGSGGGASQVQLADAGAQQVADAARPHPHELRGLSHGAV